MYRKHLPRGRMLRNTEAVWVGSEVERYRASIRHLPVVSQGKKTRPGSGESLREIDTWYGQDLWMEGQVGFEPTTCLVMCAPAG